VFVPFDELLSFGYVMAKTFIERLTRSMYDRKHAINSIIATLNRFGILSGNRMILIITKC
jgi:hypothetical protein